jgi:membrane protease YdiL (CAAX protease family)
VDYDLRPRLKVDRDLWVVLVYAALALTVLNYFGAARHFQQFFPGLTAGVPLPRVALYALFWWAGSCLVMWLAIPLLILRLLGRRPSDYGLCLPAPSGHLWIYPILFLLMLPVLLGVARTAAFLRTYPFYPFAVSHPGNWALFEVAYGLQFIAVEFFFRGFLLWILARRIGDLAVLVSMVPYCMIHFQKPLFECLGSIVAGLVLGFLALRTRSIAGGVVLHYAVALSMDILAVLVKQGIL